jgi:hypothetical protein
MFLLARLKMYMWIVGAALVAVVTVYFRGKADGRHDLEGEIKDKRIDDMLTAKEVEDEVEALDDDMLLDRANKWVRKSDG